MLIRVDQDDRWWLRRIGMVKGNRDSERASHDIPWDTGGQAGQEVGDVEGVQIRGEYSDRPGTRDPESIGGNRAEMDLLGMAEDLDRCDVRVRAMSPNSQSRFSGQAQLGQVREHGRRGLGYAHDGQLPARFGIGKLHHSRANRPTLSWGNGATVLRGFAEVAVDAFHHRVRDTSFEILHLIVRVVAGIAESLGQKGLQNPASTHPAYRVRASTSRDVD